MTTSLTFNNIKNFKNSYYAINVKLHINHFNPFLKYHLFFDRYNVESD